MKVKLLFCFMAVIFFTGCHKHRIHKVIDEVPDDITQTVVCSTLYSNIIALFPESKNNEQRYPELFNSNARQEILLSQETEVYVTFVGENASMNNTLGWYAYDSSNPPASADHVDKQLVFPNISNSVLSQGDTRQVGSGTFKAGTVIGFYLIVNGWNSAESMVDYSKQTHFTNVLLNTNHNKQHVLFKEKECNEVVVGFEDKTLDSSDRDFNDILFIVADNNQRSATASFDLQGVPAF